MSEKILSNPERDQAIRNAMAALEPLLDQESTARTESLAELICRYYPVPMDLKLFYPMVCEPLDWLKMQVLLEKYSETRNGTKLANVYLFYESIRTSVIGLVKDVWHRNNRPYADSDPVEAAAYITGSYLQFCKDASLPDMKLAGPGKQVPDFGTAQEWMELCEGIVAQCQGEPLTYLEKLKPFEKYYPEV